MKNQAFSSFLPSYEYIPDGEPHVFSDRIYLYGSHDKFGGKKFCENNYVSWSAPVNDLSDWRFDGEIYKKTQDPDNRAGKSELWAPDVVQGVDGKYYLYYCLAGDNSKLGVAVCGKPNGKFKFYGYVQHKSGEPLSKKEGDILPFDPAVLVDYNRRIWLYCGNAPYKEAQDKKRKKASVVMELEPDMLTIKSKAKPLAPLIYNSKGTGFEGHEFFEASSIRKFNGKYYFIYSSINFHELCYAMSDKPDSGFKYCGRLVSNGDIKDKNCKVSFSMKTNPNAKNYIGNNHGSIVKIGDKYYIFFHRHTNRHMFSRQACAEQIKMLSDGRFKQAELTSCGLNGKPLIGKGKYDARIACHLRSKNGSLFSIHPFIQNKKHPCFTQDGGDRNDNPNQYIQNMRDGATAGFRYFDFKKANKISMTVRGKGIGVMKVKDSENGTVVSVIKLKETADWYSFTAPLKISDGIHALYFTYEGKGAVDFLDFTLT